MRVTGKNQPLCVAGKTVSDLLGDDISVSWDGVTGRVTGSVKEVSKWKEFSDDPAEQSGNFFPATLAACYSGKPITVQKNGGAPKTLTDRNWIIRIPNKTTIVTFFADGKVIAILDFSGTTLPGKHGEDGLALKGQDEQAGYGDMKVSDLMGADVRILWDGVNGKLTGSVNNIENWAELPKDPRNGHFIVVSIDPRYKDKPLTFYKGGKPSGSTDKATDEDLFWVLRVDDTKQFSFKSGDDTIAELDCSGLILK